MMETMDNGIKSIADAIVGIHGDDARIELKSFDSNDITDWKITISDPGDTEDQHGHMPTRTNIFFANVNGSMNIVDDSKCRICVGGKTERQIVDMTSRAIKNGLEWIESINNFYDK